MHTFVSKIYASLDIFTENLVSYSNNGSFFLCKKQFLIDLFNLRSLPDERRTTTMTNDFPNDFYLPDGKNSSISQIVNKWIFGRQTPDGKEGVGVEISYLECVYGTRHYVVDKTTGNISAIHDDIIKPTDFFGHFSPFNLKELEFDVCRVADCHNGEDNSGWMMTGGRQHLMLQLPCSQPNPDCSIHSMN